MARPLGIAAVGVDEAGVAVAGHYEGLEVRRLRREHAEVDDVRLRENDRVRDPRAGMEHVVGEVRDAGGDEDVEKPVAAVEGAAFNPADRIRHPQRLEPRLAAERGRAYGGDWVCHVVRLDGRRQHEVLRPRAVVSGQRGLAVRDSERPIPIF